MKEEFSWFIGSSKVLSFEFSSLVFHLWFLFIDDKVSTQQSLSRVRLCDPMDCSPLGSSIHGDFQARVPKWVAIFSSRGSSWPRDQNQVSHVSCTVSGLFAAERLGKPSMWHGSTEIASLWEGRMQVIWPVEKDFQKMGNARVASAMNTRHEWSMPVSRFYILIFKSTVVKPHPTSLYLLNCKPW